MKSIFFALLSGLILMVSPLVSAAGIDPGLPDTLKFSSGPLAIGRSQPIDVVISNDEILANMYFEPLVITLGGGFALFDSVVYVGRMSDPNVLNWRMLFPHIDGISPDAFALVYYNAAGFPLPIGSGTVMKLYFTGLSEGSMRINVAPTSPYTDGLGFTTPGSSPHFRPIFSPLTLNVITVPLPPVLEAPITPERVSIGQSSIFEVSGSSLQGFPITLTMTDFHGYDDDSRIPVNSPSFVSGEFNWTPASADIGIWLADFEVCDSIESCVSKSVEIQVVADASYLVGFNTSEETGGGVSTGITHGDFNNDGCQELFSGGWGGTSSATAELYGFNCSDDINRIYRLADHGRYNVSPHRGYFNDDANLDVLMTGETFDWFRTVLGVGDGTGSFTLVSDGNDFVYSRSNTIGEYTGDNKLDLATTYLDNVSIYAPDATSHYRNVLTISVPDTAKTINSADFNGDGRVDLAVGTMYGLKIFLANGTPHFNQVAFYPQVYGSADIEVTNQGSDFNNDGKFDLCVSTPSVGGTYSDLMIYLGNGNGTFSQHNVRTVKGQIFGNSVGDFNGDGLVDIAFVNGARRYVGILFGDGNGTFTNEIRYPIPHDFPQHIDNFDVDNDGDLDIVVATTRFEAENSLFLLSNQLNPLGLAPHSMSIMVLNNAWFELTSPSGMSLNPMRSTIASSEYYDRDLDNDSTLDSYATVSVFEAGEYFLQVMPKPGQPAGENFSLSYLLDGELRVLARNAPIAATGYSFGVFATPQSQIQPLPGKIIRDNPPTFVWDGSGTYDFQLATDLNFSNLLVNSSVAGNSFRPSSALGVNDTTTYYWRVKLHGSSQYNCIYVTNITDVITDVSDGNLSGPLPAEYSLKQNYPNPFNPSTQIEFALPKSSQVRIAVYNVLGEEISLLADDLMAAGTHSATWEGKDRVGNDVPSGVYFYKITAGNFVESRKMLLLR